MKTRSLINEFLKQKHFAFIGVSRNEKDFSRILFRAFTAAGYEAIPVNPMAMEIDGRKCFGSVRDVSPRVTSALLLLPKYSLTRVIVKCAEAGITLLWIYGIMGPRDVSREVLAVCKEYGIEVIPGYCPFMFMQKAGWFHRLHGSVMKFVGMYPK
ncbi:MAG: CoA-binding protein [Ignavibacteriales bacterium]|jgi:predicted CoA-binding protein|nr:CoA-binding protein [Ignavibacteriales bacterium]